MIAHRSRNAAIATLLIVAVLLSACGGSPQKVDSRAYRTATIHQGQTERSVSERAAAVAMQQVGTPYRYGGQAPSGFDCSGLVHYSYWQAGRSVPRTTGQLWNSTAPLRRSQLEAGDLLFFRIGGKMQHVGLYVGDGRFVHAPSTGKRVSVESLTSEFYEQAFLRGGRLR